MAHPGGPSSQPPGEPSGVAWPPPSTFPGAPHSSPQYYRGVAPRRRRSRWLTVGLPVGIALALGGALVWFLLGAVRDLAGALGPAQQNAAAYAQALVDERWSDAHDLLCVQSQSVVTVTDLAEHYGDRELTGYRIDGVNIGVHNGVESGRVDITFTTEHGLDDVTTLPLTQDGESWRPCP